MESIVKRIDINSDVGERALALEDGSEELLISLISSANIACGGHAGDAASMDAVVGLCVRYGVKVGAHPAYPDRAGFGRSKTALSASELEASVRGQVGSLAVVALRAGVKMHHVKPHGALYNVAAKDKEVAASIGRAVSAIDKSLILVGLDGSAMLDVWKSAGFAVVGEAFADRRYEPDGTLRSRSYADGLITDPGEAARQAVRIAKDGLICAVDGSKLPVQARTICIHSDTQNAVAIAAEVRRKLEAAGVVVGPF
jgi:UPF0271 protein